MIDTVKPLIHYIGLTLVALAAILCVVQTEAMPQTQASKPATSAATQTAPDQAASQKGSDVDDVTPVAGPNGLFPAVVARVNGKAISGADMEHSVQSELSSIGNPPWENLREDYRQQLTQTSLLSLISTELVYQEAVKSGVTATKAETDAEFAKVAKSYSSDAEMNTALASSGLDRSGLSRMLVKNIIVSKYVDENITKKILVTSTELAQYYSSHTEEFQHPEMVRTSHILIALASGATPEQQKAALSRAQALLGRIKKGEDFGKVAMENSMDSSASQRGDIGWAQKGDLEPEYEAVAFSLPVGQVSDPVLTKYGYHLIKVTDKKKEGLSTLEEAKEQLTTYLKNQKAQTEMQKLVVGLQEKAKIEVLISLGAGSEKSGTASSTSKP
jgi:parvulin-like peptidyl-prolyl isomerase